MLWNLRQMCNYIHMSCENPVILHAFETEEGMQPPVYEECSNCTYSKCRFATDEPEEATNNQSVIDEINDEIASYYENELKIAMPETGDDIINNSIIENGLGPDEDNEDDLGLADERYVEHIYADINLEYACVNKRAFVPADGWCSGHWLNRSKLSDEATDEMDRLEKLGHVFKQAAEMSTKELDEFED